jgi:tetratricopeptide (TPR) repeat protein
MGLIESARTATDDPAVEAQARALSRRAVHAASDDAERFRLARQYQPAIDLLVQAARLDPGVTPQLQAVQAEYERWKDDEAERLARQGDALLEARRFAEARARYEQAAAIRPMSRARDLYRYAAHMADGEREVDNRQFSLAEASFQRALETGLDRGAAREALDRVQVRRYAVRLLGLRVRRGGPPGDLVIHVGLPDGRLLQTPPERGSWARLDSGFVVAANAYDDRTVSARVLRLVERPGDPPLELGAVTFRLSDLLARRTLMLADGAVDELRVDVVPTDRAADEVRGLAPPLQPPPPPPRPERRK